MSILGTIIMVAACVLVGYFTNLSMWQKIVAAAIIYTLCYFIFPSKSFTGDPDKDARIMNERVMEDGEDPDEVMNELINFYIEEGYGMQRAKDALNRVGNY